MSRTEKGEHLEAEAGPPGALLMSKASGSGSPGVAITGEPRRSRRDAGMFITGGWGEIEEAAAEKSLGGGQVSAQTAAYLRLGP